MKHVLLLAFLGSLSSCSSTGGTETDNPANPLKDFSSSGCKSKAAAPGQQALVLASEVEGLQCVEWEQAESGALHVRLHNFSEPCGETYLGRATQASDEAFELSVYKDVCAVAKCGSCLFDFDFELDVPLDAPLPLRIGSAVCSSEPTAFTDELSLPVDEQSSGIVCRALEHGALEWHARARGTCGGPNMPCGDCGETMDALGCESGLECTELGPSDSRCLVPCESDAECSPGLTSCQAATCQAGAGF